MTRQDAQDTLRHAKTRQDTLRHVWGNWTPSYGEKQPVALWAARPPLSEGTGCILKQSVTPVARREQKYPTRSSTVGMPHAVHPSTTSFQSALEGRTSLPTCVGHAQGSLSDANS